MSLTSIIFNTSIFSFSDKVLEYFGYKGRYYFNHFIANTAISMSTLPEIYNIYRDFNNIHLIPRNYYAINMTFAIHLYHMIVYWNKLTFDDYLHHILMVGVSLPLSLYAPCGPMIGHSLFFLTGLPGGINYGLLFLQRNGIIPKYTQKRVNKWLNLWIRMPGCIFTTALGIVDLINRWDNNSIYRNMASVIIGITIFWNGIYFMEQVVSDYSIRYKKIEKNTNN